jgi:hypothetical protein
MRLQILQKAKRAASIWLAHRLPPCKDVTQMVSDAMERKLPLRRRLEVRLHFLICVYCLRYFKQLQFMQEAAQQHATQIERGETAPTRSLPPEARERLKRSLHRQDQ